MTERFPIPLNAEQERAAKEWAADDRLWTTQETVEFNLRTFARKILSLTAREVAHDPVARLEDLEAIERVLDEDTATPPRLKTGTAARVAMYIRAVNAMRDSLLQRAEQAEAQLGLTPGSAPSSARSEGE